MTALLVLLLAVASVVDGSDRVGGRLSRMSTGVGLLVGASAIVALGVLVGWPVLHLGAGGTVVIILVATAWLYFGLVSRAWCEKSLRVRQRKQVGPGASESGADRLERFIHLACTGLLLLAVALCVVVSQPLGSRAAKMSAIVGVVVLLAVPANRVVADILAVARHSSQGNGTAVVVGCEPSRESGKQDGSRSSMRGGRWIGPLERILILLLASVEAPAAIAAIVAAKGVIRFPEISQDKAGQKAEEFLIGSFASWILAVLGAVVIHVS
ncbi:hypothetical protein BKH30_09305 [Actinomyces oris]|uniref:Beta-carotene 15,15'-monooxygenase n=2 Tax=Actinomyces oris TaxID=544580 RepID=A0A1Q8VR47_9ACTO|nr:hypothetical protein BKH30_09305 [Actinomyces oris]